MRRRGQCTDGRGECTDSRSERADGRWISSASLAIVGAYSIAAASIEPARQPRAQLHMQVVFAVGYGHLLASVVRNRIPRPRRSRLRALAPPALLAASYGVYVELCRAWPLLPIALLAVSAWHSVENDRAIRRSGLLDSRPIVPPSRAPRDVFSDLGLAAGLGAVALAAPHLSTRIDTVDVVSAVILHHLVSWLILTLARARVRGQLAATLAYLARLHLPMTAACFASMWAIGVQPRLPVPIVDVAETILSPATYLFWSAAHVMHTAWRRARV